MYEKGNTVRGRRFQNRLVKLMKEEKLINFCIRGLDRAVMNVSRKSCAVRMQMGKHAVSKFRKAVSMRIATEKGKRSNTAARFKNFEDSQQERESQ